MIYLSDGRLDKAKDSRVWFTKNSTIVVAGSLPDVQDQIGQQTVKLTCCAAKRHIMRFPHLKEVELTFEKELAGESGNERSAGEFDAWESKEPFLLDIS